MKLCLTILLLPVMAAAITFEGWMASHGLSGAAATTSADPDHDGLPNLLEYALAGGDPVIPNDSSIYPSLNKQPDTASLMWNYRSGFTGIRPYHQASLDDLQTWADVGVVQPVPERAFLRLRISHVPLFSKWADAVDSGSEVDLTPMSLAGGNGILVSPRHMLFATHYPPWVGYQAQFAGGVTRTVTALESLPNTATNYPDMTVAVLDSDVPASIHFAKVLPVNTLPSFSGYRVPAVWMDGENKVLITDLSGPNEGIIAGDTPNSVEFPERWAKFEYATSGDSGSPVCLVHDGELVVLCLWTYGGTGSGAAITDFIEPINSAMANLGGGYALTTVDLTE